MSRRRSSLLGGGPTPGLVLCVALWAHGALAHEFGVSYSRLRLGSAEVLVDLSVNVSELELDVPLDRNGDGYVAPDEVREGDDRLRRFFESGVSVTKDGRTCAGTAEELKHDGLNDAVLCTLRYPCPGGAGTLDVRMDFVTRFIHPHRNIADVIHGSQERPYLFTSERPTLSVRLVGEVGGESLLSRLARGGRTLLGTPHHLALVVGLALVAGAARSAGSFVVGHSLALPIALQGWVSLPASLVQPLIALTVAYVGLENMLARNLDRRWPLTGLFGVLHGFGLASVAGGAGGLAPFLTGFVAAEVVVLAVVVALVGRRAGAPWQGPVVRVSSVVLLASGLWWCAVRVLGLALPEVPLLSGAA